MSNKIDEINIWLNNILPQENSTVDLICLSETWMKYEQKTFLNIENYKIAGLYCRQKKAHGGVVIYARNRSDFMEVNNLKTEKKELHFEFTVVHSKKSKYTVICLYRAPVGDTTIFLDSFYELLYELNQLHYKNFIICGDFNINFSENCNITNALETILNIYDLKITITEPTRITPTSSKIIDNILTNINAQYNSQVIELGLSDHKGQILKIVNKSNPLSDHKFTEKRLFTKRNKIKFQNLLKSINWCTIEEHTDANMANDTFYSLFLDCFHEAFPTKKINISKKTNNSWLTTGIRISCKHKRDLIQLKQNKVNKGRGFINYIKLYCKTLKKVIHAAKKLHLSSKILHSGNKIKTTWEIINDLQGRNSNMQDHIVLSENDTVIKNPCQVANKFVNFFIDIAESLTSNLQSKHSAEYYINKINKTTMDSLYFMPVTENEVIEIVRLLKPKESFGWDEIPITLIKENISVLKKPLTHIINLSLSQGIFPDKFKIASIKPLFKKGDKHNISNYRPISLLPTISKILEAVVKNQLVNYLEKFKILTPFQFGFKKDCSTSDAAFKLINYINNVLENKNIPMGIFCDLSKAFDCVDHNILLMKLNYYGIRGTPLLWFTSYLKQRSAHVRLYDESQEIGKTVITEAKDIKFGVPQGSILGPVLFLIYINDLVDNFPSLQFSLFADDTSIIVSDDNLDDLKVKSEEAMNGITNWFHANKLLLNVEKTMNITFEKPHAPILDINIQTDLGQIISVTDTKFLGIYIDKSLNWSTHISDLNKRLGHAIYAVKNIKENISFAAALSVYFAYFQSILQYGVEFWGNATCFQKILITQKRAVRAICGIGPRESCRTAFKNLRIPTVVNLYIYKLAIQIYRQRNTISTPADIHDYNTRSNLKLIAPNYRYVTNRKGPLYSGVKIYNHLPNSITGINNENLFKIRLKKVLNNHVFYNLEEYFTTKF